MGVIPSLNLIANLASNYDKLHEYDLNDFGKHNNDIEKMNNYLEKIDITIQKYFKILSDEFPEFLYDYINTPEMQNFEF